MYFPICSACLFSIHKKGGSKKPERPPDKPNLADVNLLNLCCINLSNILWFYLLLILSHRFKLSSNWSLEIRLVLGAQQALSVWILVNFSGISEDDVEMSYSMNW